MKHLSVLKSLVVVCMMFIAVGCSRSEPEPGKSPAGSSAKPVAKVVPIQMGYSAWPGWFPWKIAEQEGLFEKHGIKVELRWFDGYLDSIKALAGGQLDANCQTLNDTLSSVGAGSQQVIVLVNDNSTGNDKIIVRDGIKEIADLKGKTIAAEEGTVDHFLLLLGLKKAGLTATDIKFQPLETGAAAAAFVAGKLDGVAVFAPFTTQALKRPGSKELFSSKDFPGAIPDHLVVSTEMVQKRPADVQALIDTWYDTLRFWKDNNQKAIDIMAKRAGVSVEEYRAYDAGTTIFTADDNLKAFSPGSDMSSLAHAADQIGKFLVESGNLKTPPSTAGLLDDRFVKAYAQKSK